jgi:tetratricopeptide (TPR) repeat protein/TolB-like protein
VSRRAPLLLLALAASCRAVHPAAIEERATGAARSLAPVLVESSAPAQPSWVAQGQLAAEGRVSFLGQAEASTLEAAQKAARSDLLAAVSQFVAVDVSQELKTIAAIGDGEETVQLRSVVRTESSAALEGVAADQIYWEKHLASPLAAGDSRTRYFAHAWVERAELSRARARHQAAREKGTGQRSVALLPLRALAAPGDAGDAKGAADRLAASLGEELAARLSAAGGLYVTDPAIVRGLVSPEGAAGSVERVGDALLSDVVVDGLVQRSGARVKVTLAGHDLRRGVEAVYAEAEAADEVEAGSLPVKLAAALLARLAPAATAAEPGAAPVSAPAPPESRAAREQAWTLMEQGQHEQAIAAMQRAYALAPADLRTSLKLGRLLERLGRYARLPPTPVSPPGPAPDALKTCTSTGEEASRRATARLAARAERLRTGSTPAGAQAPWWKETTLDIDVAVSLAKLELELPDDLAPAAPPLAAAPDSAAAAYLRALVLSHAQRDRAAWAEAQLALADLAVRADRIDGALPLYQALFQRGSARRDWNLASLAAYGHGVALRKQGKREEALRRLQIALVARAVLGDKPYLLEIFSELAGVASELGRADDAARWLLRALRLAEELGNDYLRTVLGNNRGVLDLRAGRLAEATGRFELAAARLAQFGESEGRIASGLNLVTALGRRGDASEARPLLEEVAALVEKSGQEGRLAELAASRAEGLALQGRTAEALESLAESFLLYRGLGRAVPRQRVQTSFLAAERSAAPGDAATLKCITRAYWEQGTPVFPAAKGERAVQTVAELAPGRLQPQDLVLALDAAAVSALTDWRPGPQAPAPPAPPLRAPAAAGLPARGAPDAPAVLIAAASRSLAAERALRARLSAMGPSVGACARAGAQASLGQRHQEIAGAALALLGRLASGDSFGAEVEGGRLESSSVEAAREVTAAEAACRPPGPRCTPREAARDFPPPPGMDSTPPTICHEPITEARRGEVVTLRALIEDPSGAAFNKVFVRFKGEQPLMRYLEQDGPYWSIKVRARAEFDYWFEAYDVFGNGPARDGTAEHPHHVKLRGDEGLDLSLGDDRSPTKKADGPPPSKAAPPPKPEASPPAQAAPPSPAPPPTAGAPSAPKAAEAPPRPEYVPDGVPVTARPGGAREKPATLPAVEYKKPAQYDRILGAALVDPDVLVLLDPFETGSAPGATAARAMLAAIAAQLGALGLPREAAIARLDAAGLAWASGEHEAGYRELLVARDQLAALGDVPGLAHAYEWLGHMLAQSGESGLAADDLGLALRLYRLLGDEPAAQRVLAGAAR